MRQYAKQIHDATGVAGYATMALDNAGGWQLAAGANARGGVIETFDGTKYTATLERRGGQGAPGVAESPALGG